MKKLSHYDSAGSPRMVDVSAKPDSRRTARAQAFVRIAPDVLARLPKNPKGNPLEIARIAGIAAAKKTSDLIPLCHPLMLSHADVELRIEKQGIRIGATAATTGQTGVEMEALTAAAVAALTVYDMKISASSRKRAEKVAISTGVLPRSRGSLLETCVRHYRE
jgi:cyclic pyranopterin phosphate synthase